MASTTYPETDPVLFDDWHVVGEIAALAGSDEAHTVLLGIELRILPNDDTARLQRVDGVPVHMALRYGFVWACLGTPARAIPDIPEYEEARRTITTSGAFGVHASAPRVVENFLDLGHLGYVHAGYLGAEPHTEVASYDVREREGGGVVATGCKVYQPVASPTATTGYVVDYIYEVVRPLTACLYKANPVHRERFDVIYLFVQPVDEERSIAHALILFVEDGASPADLRSFQQLIFLQDKPILENQHPRRLPIGPRMEMPILADKTSIAYRRWLMRLGLRFGVIRDGDPAAQAA